MMVGAFEIDAHLSVGTSCFACDLSATHPYYSSVIGELIGYKEFDRRDFGLMFGRFFFLSFLSEER